MYIPVAALLALRQLAPNGAMMAGRDLVKPSELLRRQDTTFIPKGDSPEQQAHDAQQAADAERQRQEEEASRQRVNEFLTQVCATDPASEPACQQPVYVLAYSWEIGKSGLTLSLIRRRQDTAFIPKGDSPEQQALDAQQAADAEREQQLSTERLQNAIAEFCAANPTADRCIPKRRRRAFIADLD
ncbi:hypothetical protein DL96DRAFT_1639627 [Flagelloscypha sp. PMI_526]|nr:hypothetical protein DL96DRAFT_1639627 [Flagelloscypha sp. PMI_526]